MAVDIDAAALTALPEGIARFQADLTDEAQVAGVIAACVAELGGIDCLVNAAAVAEFR